MTNENKYAVLYKLNNFTIGVGSENIKLSSENIVSITIINNYDTMTYPIVRFRLYVDITILEQIMDKPDEIKIMSNMIAGVYKLNSTNDSNGSPTIVSGAENITLSMNGYIETKNAPVSFADRYDKGLLKEKDMNNNIKVPIEIYGYHKQIVSFMRSKPASIYKSISLQTTIENMFHRLSLSVDMDTLDNQMKYDQILIPNLSLLSAVSYLNEKFGLYKKGGQVYHEIYNPNTFTTMRICDSDVNRFTKDKLVSLYVYKQTDTNQNGMVKIGTDYQFATMVQNVTVLSESDIEQILTSPIVTTENVSLLKLDMVIMDKLFPELSNRDNSTLNEPLLQRPSIFHYNVSNYIALSHAARINEKITKIDISGVGFDIGKMKIDTRYGLVFESPIRGANINQYYRATFANHVITNMSGDLFIANTTMSLVSN